MVLTYRQTIQQAFRGLSDALVEYHKDWEFREYQQQLGILGSRRGATL
jgi:outer membrane protein TolC